MTSRTTQELRSDHWSSTSWWHNRRSTVARSFLLWLLSSFPSFLFGSDMTGYDLFVSNASPNKVSFHADITSTSGAHWIAGYDIDPYSYGRINETYWWPPHDDSETWSGTVSIYDGTNQIPTQASVSRAIFIPATTWPIVVFCTYDGNGIIAEPTRTDVPVATAGDPFDVLNGNAMRDETDLCLPAPSLPLIYGRSYNSLLIGSNEFGAGWHAWTDWSITPPSSPNFPIALMAGNGRRYSIPYTGSNWVCTVDVRCRLTPETNGEWTLDACDSGIAMRFGTNGLWCWLDDGWGNRIVPNRDSVGHITNLVHTCGRALTIVWTNNRVNAVFDTESTRRVDYSYNAAGLLTGVVQRAATGETVSSFYCYDSVTKLLTNSINAAGQTIVHQYAPQDGLLHCVSSSYADGTFAVNATWDTTNGLTRLEYAVASESNRVSSVYWTPSRSRVAAVAAGGTTQKYFRSPDTLEPTGTTWFSASHTAAVWHVCDRAGRTTNSVSVYDGSSGASWTTEWHPSLDLITATVDPLGWRAEYTWTNGLLSSARATNGYGGWITSSLIYSQGLLTATSDPLNRTNYFQYDDRGVLAGVTPAAGPAVAFSNDALGNMVCAWMPGEDGIDREWDFDRDGFGNITNAVAPDGIAVQGYYDAIGNLTGLVDRAGRRISITYGVASTPLSITRTITENGSNRTVTIAASRDFQMDATAVIDPLGRSVESYVRDDAGRIATITNVEGRVATVQYGAADLPISVTRFDGTVNTLNYNGDWKVTSSVLPSRTNTFSWLANGLLASAANEQATVTNLWIAPGWMTSQATITSNWTGQVNYACDLSGAITQVTANAIGLSATRQFDGGGGETNRTLSCNGVQLASSRGYGSWNELPVSINTGPIQQTMGWDVLNRLTNLTWQAHGQTVREIQFFYDVLGQITQRVDTAAGVDTIRSYSYDGLDRLASETHSDGFSASYFFDDAGRRTAKSTADFGVNYSNDIGDRLAGWSVGRTSLTVSVAGTASKTIGTNTQFGMRQVYNGTGAATPVINGSNFTATLQAEPLGTQTVVALVSDLAGNVGVATNRYVLTAYTAGAYSSDAAGCVTQIVYQGPFCRQSKVLSWDVEYRLSSVATNGATAETYGFDPFGRRIVTTAADGTVTRYLNDGQHVLADLDSTGGVLRTYFYGPNADELLAMTVCTRGVAQTYYAIRDHQNTVWAWVDGNGAVVESYDFDAWGRVLSVTDGSGNAVGTSVIGNRYLFQGREYSWATGLYYFRARWYDPVTGRWLSPDKIGISGGWNQFVFCANNPVNAVDPDGLATYLINRSIGGTNPRGPNSYLSHTFVAVYTPASGGLQGGTMTTYGWGTTFDKDKNGQWCRNALSDPDLALSMIPDRAERVGDDSLDPYIQDAYDILKNSDGSRHKWKLDNNCKNEADKLVSTAEWLRANKIPHGYLDPARK